MIHLVFNEADIKVLQEAIQMDEELQGTVMQIKDDFAVGPLNNIYSTHGINERNAWWREILSGGDYDGRADTGEVDDTTTLEDIISELRSDPAQEVWIWAAQNKHDVCGYYWLLHYLKEFQGRVFILYLNNLPFINNKGSIFYPSWLHSIPPKEFLKAKKLARLITPAEFEVDTDEWLKISSENKGVRLLEGGKKLLQEDYDFYDKALKSFITPDWQKASKIIHQFLSKALHTTGDAYLLWRLKVMIAYDLFDVQGNVGNMKDFELKIKV